MTRNPPDLNDLPDEFREAILSSARRIEESHRLIRAHLTLLSQWAEAIRESRELLSRSRPEGWANQKRSLDH